MADKTRCLQQMHCSHLSVQPGAHIRRMQPTSTLLYLFLYADARMPCTLLHQQEHPLPRLQCRNRHGLPCLGRGCTGRLTCGQAATASPAATAIAAAGTAAATAATATAATGAAGRAHQPDSLCILQQRAVTGTILRLSFNQHLRATTSKDGVVHNTTKRHPNQFNVNQEVAYHANAATALELQEVTASPGLAPLLCDCFVCCVVFGFVLHNKTQSSPGKSFCWHTPHLLACTHPGMPRHTHAI